MSRVSIKRHFDVLNQETRSPSCCSHRLQLTDPSNRSSINIQSPQTLSEHKQLAITDSEEQNNHEMIEDNRSIKRIRTHLNQMDEGIETDTNNSTAAISACVESKSNVRNITRSSARDDQFTQAVLRIPARRIVVDDIIVGHKRKKHQQLFTKEDVEEIVQRAVERAVKEREEILNYEYSKILNNLLREQFDNFSRFNQDYISRQIKKSDFSYLS